VLEMMQDRNTSRKWLCLFNCVSDVGNSFVENLSNTALCITCEI